jgi:hypothetical protein
MGRESHRPGVVKVRPRATIAGPSNTNRVRVINQHEGTVAVSKATDMLLSKAMYPSIETTRRSRSTLDDGPERRDLEALQLDIRHDDMATALPFS